MAKLIEEVERTSRVVIRRRYASNIDIRTRMILDGEGKPTLDYYVTVTMTELEYDKETRQIVGNPVVVGVYALKHEELLTKGLISDLNAIGRVAQERHEGGDQDYGPPPG